MDKISFQISDPKMTSKSDIMYCDVSVILNDQKLPYQLFNGGEVIAASHYEFAEFDLYTCECGIPGCAGFHSEVVQKKTSQSVVWQFPDDGSYKVQKLNYEFNRSEFEVELNHLKEQLLKRQEEGIHLLYLVQGNDQYVQTTPVEETYSVPTKLSESIEWNLTEKKSVQDFHQYLMKNYADLYDKKFNVNYKGNNHGGDLSFSYLVCRLLNEWPQRKNKKGYMNRVQAGAQALKKMLASGDMTQMVQLYHDNYKNFAENPEDSNPATSTWFAFEHILYHVVPQQEFQLSELKLTTK